LRKLDKEKALETLSEIERLTSMPGKDGGAIAIGLPGLDAQAFDLAIKIARRKGGLTLLVEKYSASRSQIVVGVLALMLTERAKRKKPTEAYLLFEFIEKLQRRDHSSVLVTVLTAIKYQIGLAKAWRHTKIPESVYPFLQHCLAFTGARANWIHRSLSDDVQLSAIDLLRTMCEADIYNLNFDDSQRNWIENKVKEVVSANSEKDWFQQGASYFFDCVVQQPSPSD